MESTEGFMGCIMGCISEMILPSQVVMVAGFSQHQALRYLPHLTSFLTAFFGGSLSLPDEEVSPHGLLLSPPTFCREQRLHGHHGHAKHQQVLL